MLLSSNIVVGNSIWFQSSTSCTEEQRLGDIPDIFEVSGDEREILDCCSLVGEVFGFVGGIVSTTEAGGHISFKKNSQSEILERVEEMKAV